MCGGGTGWTGADDQDIAAFVAVIVARQGSRPRCFSHRLLILFILSRSARPVHRAVFAYVGPVSLVYSSVSERTGTWRAAGDAHDVNFQTDIRGTRAT